MQTTEETIQSVIEMVYNRGESQQSSPYPSIDDIDSAIENIPDRFNLTNMQVGFTKSDFINYATDNNWSKVTCSNVNGEWEYIYHDGENVISLNSSRNVSGQTINNVFIESDPIMVNSVEKYNSICDYIRSYDDTHIFVKFTIPGRVIAKISPNNGNKISDYHLKNVLENSALRATVTYSNSSTHMGVDDLSCIIQKISTFKNGLE